MFLSAFLAVLAALSSPARAVVGGVSIEDLPEADAKVFEPVLKIAFDGGRCTGTWVGADRILTAHHCASQEPKELCVSDHRGKRLDCVWRGDFIVRTLPGAPMETAHDSSGRELRVASPDLALVEIRSRGLLKKLGALKPARIPESVAPEELRTARIAGQGCNLYWTRLFQSDGGGELRQGFARVTTPAAGFYKLLWIPSDAAHSGACPGDSGGPLFGVDAAGELSLYGVAAAIVKPSNASRRHPAPIISKYTRLDDSTAVRAWLVKELQIR